MHAATSARRHSACQSQFAAMFCVSSPEHVVGPMTGFSGVSHSRHSVARGQGAAGPQRAKLRGYQHHCSLLCCRRRRWSQSQHSRPSHCCSAHGRTAGHLPPEERACACTRIHNRHRPLCAAAAIVPRRQADNVHMHDQTHRRMRQNSFA
eukprot:GHVU01158125.1.p2 GENE.GHVU01158125.1~~GHVU01158125.1.p2  ORF type:complete len:150 (-),score=4.52 GHVU01158125.1:299-748(-)